MLLLIFTGLMIVAVCVLVFGRRAYRQGRVSDLGTVSDGWIASHRTSPYEPNR